MWILGYSGGDKRAEDEDHFGCSVHDACAVLLHGDTLVAAIEEERLNRIKHTNCFPVNAIQRCLDLAGIGLSDVDWVATNTEEKYVNYWATCAVLQDPTVPTPRKARDEIAAPFHRSFGVDVRSKIRFCHHHEAHLWSAYFLSGYDECLAVSIDGQGDDFSWLIGVGQEGRITKVRDFSVGHSLGNLYTNVIQLLGYRRFDEYKAMGLAPYGDAGVFQPLFEQCYSLLPNGDYTLRPWREWLQKLDSWGLLERARRKGCPFQKTHEDVAAALQAMLERIALHVLAHEQRKTGQRKLSLAGGVAHNCSLNGVIANSGLFDQVFVQPAAHDAGGALGAAYSVLVSHYPASRPVTMTHVHLGADLMTSEETRSRLESWSPFVAVKERRDVARETARLLADGAVIGWMQGRAEFGPRALGNRSIVADARPAENKKIINAMVKKREQYRPFAPSVIDTEASKYFELPGALCDLSFMTFVVKVREEFRSTLQAITHVDGTARIQTVSRETNRRYWDLLRAFADLTGFPILLNTSFNNNAEPIVDSLDDAVACFLTTGLHYLVVDTFIVEKIIQPDGSFTLLDLAPELPSHRRLVKRKKLDEHRRYVTCLEIESSKSTFFGPKTVGIAPETYYLLEAADGRQSARSLLERAGLWQPASAGQLQSDLAALWADRWIRMTPADGAEKG